MCGSICDKNGGEQLSLQVMRFVVCSTHLLMFLGTVFYIANNMDPDLSVSFGYEMFSYEQMDIVLAYLRTPSLKRG